MLLVGLASSVLPYFLLIGVVLAFSLHQNVEGSDSAMPLSNTHELFVNEQLAKQSINPQEDFLLTSSNEKTPQKALKVCSKYFFPKHNHHTYFEFDTLAYLFQFMFSNNGLSPPNKLSYKWNH